MKLENQVTSLELSKRLKELGVKQESLFEYAVDPILDKVYSILPVTSKNSVKEYTVMHKVYSAFTVAELGEMLPREFQSYKCLGVPKSWQVSHNDLEWHSNPKKGICREAPTAPTEVEVRAKMLIYLLENNLI